VFALRGLAVSLSIFLIFYLVLSSVVRLVWRRVWLHGQLLSARTCSNLLFALRLAPNFLATLVTLAFAIPSFVMFEPRAVEESMSATLIGLSFCSVAVIFAGFWNAAIALKRAFSTVASWADESQALLNPECGSSVPILRTSAASPPLTAAGIFRPTVWLSAAAEFVLSDRELQSALRHEVAHVRRRDNLRKLLLRLVALPGMAQLERAWRETTEIAADDAAVSSTSEALDLAAAVIKLARLTPSQPAGELMTALVDSPAELVNARVQRLLRWSDHSMAPENQDRRSLIPYAAIASTAFFVLVFTYGHLLVGVHAATEWLVR
jgi:hypothetical protein